jgi:hypothetical protein
MKMLIILMVCAWSVSCVLAEPVRCSGFEESDPKSPWNSNKNVSCEILETRKGEVIPEGKKYLKVTMTITDDQAWMNFKIPKDKIPAKATKITMWIKGDPENKGRGPCLSLGKWGWNAWKPSRIIDISEPGWVKYEFRTDSFLQPAVPKAGKMKINEYQYFYITLKKIYNNSGTITFCIDNIEIE